MSLKRIKAYKARKPAETIEYLQSIFTDLGFHFSVENLNRGSPFSACQLSLINLQNKRQIYCTNGKGLSTEWALASAWGEMIERFQNLAFYMIHLYPAQPECANSEYNWFKYYPDEKKDGQQAVEIPFTELTDNEEVYYPVRAFQVLVGSNGMCSGNTKEEALIQGISEVFERHVLKSIYLEPFCPPDIPLDLFADSEILSKIEELTNKFEYTIQIKDCSMGKAYPVIGVLIRNKKNGYAFHLGADPSPITALERCLTEMFQSGEVFFLPMEELEHHSPYRIQDEFWRKNLSRTIRSYEGHWPHVLLTGDPSYAFTGFDHGTSVSDEDDLNFLVSILKKENKKLFIRDNSFLGQAAYHIYIPGMSEITNCPDDAFYKAYLEFDGYLETLTNIPQSDKTRGLELAEKISEYAEVSPSKEFRASEYFAFFKEHPLARLSQQEIISLLKNGGTSQVFPEADSSIPVCFECKGCHKNHICNFPFITETWEKVKKLMIPFYL